MNQVFGYMFLRPGNLWKDFGILRRTQKNENGHLVSKWEATGDHAHGILTQATNMDVEKNRHRYNQEQNSLTHTIVIRGTKDVRKGDLLTLDEESYLVLCTDDIGALGGVMYAYLEERNDVK